MIIHQLRAPELSTQGHGSVDRDGPTTATFGTQFETQLICLKWRRPCPLTIGPPELLGYFHCSLDPFRRHGERPEKGFSGASQMLGSMRGQRRSREMVRRSSLFLLRSKRMRVTMSARPWRSIPSLKSAGSTCAMLKRSGSIKPRTSGEYANTVGVQLLCYDIGGTHRVH